MRKKVPGPAVPWHPSCWWTASCSAHMTCPVQAPAQHCQLPFEWAWLKQCPGDRQVLATGHHAELGAAWLTSYPTLSPETSCSGQV